MVLNNGIARQVIAASTACFGAVVLGGAIGYSSPAIRSMEADTDSNIVLTEEQKSWIGSFNPLGAVVGAVFAGPVVDYLGRKTTLMYVSSLGFLASFLLIGFSVNIGMMYAGRILGGAMLGLTLVADSLYIVETSEVKVRGMTGSFPQTYLSIGILFAYGAGSVVKWNELAWICCVLCVPLFFGMMLVPECPIWLLRKGRRAEAEHSLKWLRQDDTECIEKELIAIEASINTQRSHTVTWRDLARPYALRPFVISLIVMFFRQGCGINAVIYFNALIFEKAGSDLNPDTCAIIVGVIQIIGCVAANLLVEQLGRRVLLLISFILMGVCVALIGLFFFWLENKEDMELVSKVGWIPLASLMLFIFGYCIGIGPLSWTVTSEIIPVEFKSLCVSVANSFNWLVCFVVTAVFLPMNDALGTYTSFWIFAGLCALATIYIFIILPETKGKTANEIRMIFDNEFRRRSLAVAAPTQIPRVSVISASSYGEHI